MKSNPTDTPLNQDSPTPRTDAHICAGYDLGDAIDPDFARQLEREVNVLEAALRKEAENIYHTQGVIKALREVERMRSNE